ncbi:Ankycorbin [Dactylella cylindrospora]|nr:Ankycorbin [Dactylella cylindrospora]
MEGPTSQEADGEATDSINELSISEYYDTGISREETGYGVFIETANIMRRDEMPEEDKCQYLRGLSAIDPPAMDPCFVVKLLRITIRMGLKECFDLILSRSCLDKNYTNKSGATLLHIVSADIQPEDSELYFLGQVLQLGIPDEEFLEDQLGNHPLHLAVSQGNVTAVELIHQALPESSKNVPGLIPMVFRKATRENAKKVLKFLHRSGYDINEVNKEGYSYLHIAIKSQPFWVTELLARYGGYERSALQQGVRYTPRGEFMTDSYSVIFQVKSLKL